MNLQFVENIQPRRLAVLFHEIGAIPKEAVFIPSCVDYRTKDAFFPQSHIRKTPAAVQLRFVYDYKGETVDGHPLTAASTYFIECDDYEIKSISKLDIVHISGKLQGNPDLESLPVNQEWNDKFFAYVAGVFEDTYLHNCKYYIEYEDRIRTDENPELNIPRKAAASLSAYKSKPEEWGHFYDLLHRREIAYTLEWQRQERQEIVKRAQKLAQELEMYDESIAADEEFLRHIDASIAAYDAKHTK